MFDIKHPHDSFFKILMSDVQNVADFIRGFLPEKISSKVDYSSIKLIDTEKNKKDYKRYYLDIITECLLDGTKSEIYFLFEHKSYKDKMIFIQLLSYCLSVWETNLAKKEPLRLIVPVVFYHNKMKYNIPLNFADYFQVSDDLKGYVLNFSYELVDVVRYSEDSVTSRCFNNLYLASSLMALRNIFMENEKLIDVLRILSGIEKDKIEYIFNYIIFAKDMELNELNKLIEQGGLNNMPSLGERLMQKSFFEGLNEGLFKGKVEGKIEGTRQNLFDVLNVKFGSMPSEIENKINSINNLETLREFTKIAVKSVNIEQFNAEIKNYH